jgi:mRNA interferase RelE/StbE
VRASYTIDWTLLAIDAAAGYLSDDLDGLGRVMDHLDDLAIDPCPDGSVPGRSPGLMRWRIDRYRVLYRIDEATSAVTVIHLGRIG